ncbi:MAG: MaoC/PaaZ C-terminal domain-containing protein [Anaeromyxobacteraceae bacterium]
MALAARQLYFEAVKVGDELPPLVKPPFDRIQIARYAGAAQDFSPLYVDEQYARNSGFPSVLVPAVAAMGFLAELVVDWLRGARLRRFQARFVKIVWPGDVLTCRGRVVERRFEPNGAYAVDIELWSENQRGELAVRGLVTAQLYYSAEDEQRQRQGQAPIVVTPQEEEARLAKLSRAQPAKAPPPPPPPKAKPPAPKHPPRPVAVAPTTKPPVPVAASPRTGAAVAAPARPAPAAPAKAAPAAPAKSTKPVTLTKPPPKPAARSVPKSRSAARPSRPAPKPQRAKPKAAQPRAKPVARGRSGGGARPPKKRR